jgi:hypothetical protein
MLVRMIARVAVNAVALAVAARRCRAAAIPGRMVMGPVSMVVEWLLGLAAD